MRRRPPAPVVTVALALALFLVLAAAPLVVAAPPAGATAIATEAAPAVPTTRVVSRGDELGNSLPRPNSGTPPRRSGDRGGAAQTALFFVLLAATLFIAFMVWREVRRQRQRALSRAGQS